VGLSSAFTITSEETKDLLRGLPLLESLPDELLAEMADQLLHVPLKAGEWLFRAGDPATTAFLIASGRLEVVDEAERVIRVLRRGALLGELALLRDGARSASVRAVRDSQLVCLRRDHFERLLQEAPGFGLALMRTIGERLVSSLAPAAAVTPARTLAVLVLEPDISAPAAMAALATEIDGLAVLDGTEGDWSLRLAVTEAQHDRVLLITSAFPDDPWTTFCLHEADVLVALTRGQPHPMWDKHLESLRDCELVVLGGKADDTLVERLKPSRVRACPNIGHAMRELGRRFDRRAIGLVLSGGGARAMSHLGVIEEIVRAGIRIDRIAGVSLGALVAASVARGDSPEESYTLFEKHFVHRNPTKDYTIPVVSLLRGGRTSRAIAEEFGDLRIESLSVPYWCASTDLLRRESVIHRTGSLAHAVRASLSLPGIFPPVRDGDRLLVDGGVIDNLPVEIMAEEAAGPVVAIDVTGTAGRKAVAYRPRLRPILTGITGSVTPLPRLPETIIRCMTLASKDTVAAAGLHADVIITPEVAGIGLLDWRRLPEMREAGRIAARKMIAELADL
jgi:predicted acylesterase/phospholipase RssA/CRP-like cAMP-binding protein